MNKPSYDDKAKKVVAAIEVAVNSFKSIPPKDWDEKTIQHVVKTHLDWKEVVLNPLPQYKNMTSLRILESDVLTFFQEGSGETVDYFWLQIKDKGIDYKRENKLAKILRKKKIKTEIEYNFVIDTIVPYQQEGIIDSYEVDLLNKLLLEYEQKGL